MRHRSTSGFTLIELLVSIAIIGLLVALFLPAVQQSRAAARTTVCKNRLKQLALATHNFHDVHDAFPPARLIQDIYFFVTDVEVGASVGRDEPPWLIRLLPYIEQGALSEEWDEFAIYNRQDEEVREKPLTMFLCPERHSISNAVSDDQTFTSTAPCGCPGGVRVNPRGAVTDYVASHGDLSPGASGSLGDFYWGGKGTGVIISSNPKKDSSGVIKRDWIDRVSFDNIRDGATNTFLIGESHVPSGELNKSPYNGAAYIGRYLFHFARLAGPGVPISHGPKDTRAFEYSFGSNHRGFVNFAFADGRVSSVNTSISSTTAGNLANRKDGQNVGEF